MKLVIDIDEEDYAVILANADIVNKRKKHTLEEAVLNGIPLPKGHGRLIDADALIFNADYNEPLISKRDFDFAPTIIEAESEE